MTDIARADIKPAEAASEPRSLCTEHTIIIKERLCE